MSDWSRAHCLEVYPLHPADLAVVCRHMRASGDRRLRYVPESFLFYWAMQLAEAVTALHELGILHCDLHPENVLVDQRGNLLLHDFGLSKRLPDPRPPWSACWLRIPRKFREDFGQFARLEAGWWPPELAEAFRGRGYPGFMNHTVDWYGLGATLFALRTGRYPLELLGRGCSFEDQLARALAQAADRQQPPLSPDFAGFIGQLLRERIPERLGHRGDGREVLSHRCIVGSPWFAGCDSWEVRRDRIRQRGIPQPYTIEWLWPPLPPAAFATSRRPQDVE